MTEFLFDHPVPEMLEDADDAAIAAIDEGLAQLDTGQGIATSETRQGSLVAIRHLVFRVIG